MAWGPKFIKTTKCIWKVPQFGLEFAETFFWSATYTNIWIEEQEQVNQKFSIAELETHPFYYNVFVERY